MLQVAETLPQLWLAVRDGSTRREGGPRLLQDSSAGWPGLAGSRLPVTAQGCPLGPSAMGRFVPEQSRGAFSFPFWCPVAETHVGMLVIKLTFMFVKLELPEAVESRAF